MKTRILKAIPVLAETLTKGMMLPDNTTVLGVEPSGTIGKLDLIVIQEYEVEEKKEDQK